MSTPESEWYWDLKRNIAVQADQRGQGDDMLGPYNTRGEAENWKSKVEARNQAWDEADEAWEGTDPDAK
jgi:hypothetical protein